MHSGIFKQLCGLPVCGLVVEAWALLALMAAPTLANALVPAPAMPRASQAVALDVLRVDLVVVRKQSRVIELYAGGKLVRVIEHIQLGRAPIGPKHFQGDQRTPEGRYVIDFGKPDSDYHLALHISYPASQDSEFAAKQGQSAGGAIYIHGQPNDWPKGRVPGDWTAGCIALSNAEIEELWRLVDDGTPIDIRP